MGNYSSSFTGVQVDSAITNVLTNKLTRTATLVVAANDSSAKCKAQADYVCDGVNDEVEIQAAIDALPSTGTRTVKLMGSFVKGNVTAITIPSDTHLELDGKITFGVVATGAIMFSAATASGISIIGGKLDGNGSNQAAGYRTLIQLTDVKNSKIDTYMTNISVDGYTVVSTIRGAYVKQIGNCYGNVIINRKFPNTLKIVDVAQWNNSEQYLISNCDTGWTLPAGSEYSTEVYLSAGSSVKLGPNLNIDLVLPSAIDFTGATLHALVRLDFAPNEAGGAVILRANFETDGTSKLIGNNLTITDDGIKDKWIHVSWHPGKPSGGYNATGVFDEKRLTQIGLRLYAPAAAGYIYIDRLWYTHSTKPIISFSFDDGLSAAKTAYATVLNKYGLRGVWAVNSANVGTTNYMTLAELKDLQKLGHEIVCHGAQHHALSFDSAASCEDNGLGSQDYLINHGFIDGARHIILPYTGMLSAEGYDSLKNNLYFYSTRPGINSLPELPSPYIYRYNAKTLAEWQEAVDETIKRGGWLIHFCHSPAMDSLSAEVYEQMVQYVLSKGLHVATFSEVIDYYSKIPVETSKKFGTGTITAGQTSVDVAHGLLIAPTKVIISPTADTGGKRYWVSAKAATTFTATIDSAAESDITFDWEARL
jgi:peptidoglycan/xylan/chitin deacetylase (PgdA/CDA1 family)